MRKRQKQKNRPTNDRAVARREELHQKNLDRAVALYRLKGKKLGTNMTVEQISQITGVPVKRILRALV